MIVDAKQINIGPNINTIVSTNLVQISTVESITFSLLKTKRRPPTVKARREDEDEVGLLATADDTIVVVCSCRIYIIIVEKISDMNDNRLVLFGVVRCCLLYH